MHRNRGFLAALVAAVLTVGVSCVEKQAYWTLETFGEAEFRRASESCIEKAQADVAREPAYRGELNTRNGYRPDDPANAPATENERRRKERRVRGLYGQCMEMRGWVSNTEGKGFKGL